MKKITTNDFRNYKNNVDSFGGMTEKRTDQVNIAKS